MFERLGIFRQKQTDIKFGDLQAFLRERFESEEKDLEAKLASNVDEIKKVSSELKATALKLKSNSSQDKYSSSIKDRFCDKLVENVDMLLSSGSNNRKLVDLSENVVKSAGDINMKEFRHLSKFREDMSKIAEKVKIIEEKIKASRKFISNSRLTAVDSIKDCISFIDASQKNIKNIDEEIERLRSDIDTINKTCEVERINCNSLNEKLSSFEAEKTGMQNIERDMENIRQKINAELSGLERPMKKFMYYGDLTKEEQKILKDLISDPAACFIDSNHEVVKRIMECMSSYKSRDVIDIDDRKLGKLHDVLRHFEFLIELKEQYKALDVKLEMEEAAFCKKTDPVADEIRLSAARVSELEKDMENRKNSVGASLEEKKLLEEKILKKMEQIRVLLASVTDPGVNLV